MLPDLSDASFQKGIQIIASNVYKNDAPIVLKLEDGKNIVIMPLHHLKEVKENKEDKRK